MAATLARYMPDIAAGLLSGVRLAFLFARRPEIG